MARLIPIATFFCMAMTYGVILTIIAPWVLGTLAHAMWHHFLQGWNYW